MARQYDTSKHNECYRPIPVHTPSNRRVPTAKPYTNVASPEGTSAPRYEPEYDYKTTHYPSYPPNYPYDDNKYKYDGGQTYNAYEKPTYVPYEETVSYDARGYVAPPHAAATPNSAYPSDAEYTRYTNYDGRAAYPIVENPEYSEKGRYNYGYEQRGYYEADGRYAVADCRYTMDMRYPDARHADNRAPADNREADCRYVVDNRDMDRRYAVETREPDGRYTVENREIDNRYAPVDGREVDARFADPARYPTKENYYDRYYKHRPSRDHHVADTSRY